MTAIWGPIARSSIPSNCQLESSRTTGVSLAIMGSAATAEMPMFPAATVSGRHCRSISAHSAVVLVLPLVPVTPITAAGHARRKRAISISTGTPAACAVAKNGLSRRTPGLRTTASVTVKSDASCLPNTKRMSRSANSAI